MSQPVVRRRGRRVKDKSVPKNECVAESPGDVLKLCDSVHLPRSLDNIASIARDAWLLKYELLEVHSKLICFRTEIRNSEHYRLCLLQLYERYDGLKEECLTYRGRMVQLLTISNNQGNTISDNGVMVKTLWTIYNFLENAYRQLGSLQLHLGGAKTWAASETVEISSKNQSVEHWSRISCVTDSHVVPIPDSLFMFHGTNSLTEGEARDLKRGIHITNLEIDKKVNRLRDLDASCKVATEKIQHTEKMLMNTTVNGMLLFKRYLWALPLSQRNIWLSHQGEGGAAATGVVPPVSDLSKLILQVESDTNLDVNALGDLLIDADDGEVNSLVSPTNEKENINNNFVGWNDIDIDIDADFNVTTSLQGYGSRFIFPPSGQSTSEMKNDDDIIL